MREEVVITGLGVVSPIGDGCEGYWRSLADAEPTKLEDHPVLLERQMANRLIYQVDPRAGEDGQGVVRNGLATRIAVAAARQAILDSGLEEPTLRRAGVSFATAMGDSDLLERANDGRDQLREGEAFVHKTAAVLARSFDLRGPNHCNSGACAAGLYSVALGMDLIRDGLAEVMLVGGAEGFSRVALGCFNRIGGLDPKSCRPFAGDRQGTVFGEGAAAMVLEAGSHARRRGARAYARIKGCGWSCDAHHATAPEPSGQQIKLAVQRAMADAGSRPGDVSHVVPHATGTELNDLVESRMMREVFGEQPLVVCAIKSRIGHGGGAAGAFSCLTGALIVHRGAAPFTLAAGKVDPRCSLSLAAAGRQPRAVGQVLVNAYAFGGNNISMILEGWRG